MVCPSQAWLCTELLARLARWSAEPRKSLSTGTLGLLPLEPYSRTYRRLKDKYGGLVKVTEERGTIEGWGGKADMECRVPHCSPLRQHTPTAEG